MAELSDFLPYVRRQISGPLNIMMTDALSMAAVAFSRQSLVCRREVTVVPVAGKEIVLPYDKDDEECVHIIRKRKLTAVCSHQTRIGNLDAHLTQTDI